MYKGYKKMFTRGDMVKYHRAYPKEIGLVYRVAGVFEDSEGCWVLLDKSRDSVPNTEISVEQLLVFGTWEPSFYFEFAD